MNRIFRMSLVAMFLLFAVEAQAAADVAKKKEAVAAVDQQQARMTKMSDQIWAFAETALREVRSSNLLADYAEEQGFQVQRGVAGLPTAFIASYGQGRPIIGILGEYDALPGISQKASPAKEPLVAGAGGHGCGHNLFGVASLGAAVAIKNLIASGKLKGTIRFYGTPAEESVGGKVYIAREGLFKDLDVALAWHPDDETKADTGGSQAILDFIVEFHGKAAHAAFDPWNGRSALDGAELFLAGLNRMRERIKPSVRIHYVIQSGGDVPNVVPEYAKVWCWVRDSSRQGMEEVFARVREVARGAALMAGVESKLTVQAGDYEMLVNMAGAKLLHENLMWVGPLEYTSEEQEFARAIQRATGKPEKGIRSAIQPLKPQPEHPPGGSTDVADVSWNVPMLYLNTATAPEGTPWHSWAVVATGGMSIGHKGMMQAAKTLAATMVDLFDDASARGAIQAEFREKTKGFVYKPYVPDGPPPVPKN